MRNNLYLGFSWIVTVSIKLKKNDSISKRIDFMSVLLFPVMHCFAEIASKSRRFYTKHSKNSTHKKETCHADNELEQKLPFVIKYYLLINIYFGQISVCFFF